MEYRVNSQSTLTRQPGMLAAHSSLPPHMQTEQHQHMHNQMKLPNGSPRGYSSMERNIQNSSINLPQVPPSYTPHQYNSLQRNTPLQIQNSNPPQMMPQMSMPAPTPPPPYGGGGHMTPQMLNSSGILVSPQIPGQHTGSMQFAQAQNSFPASYAPVDMHQACLFIHGKSSLLKVHELVVSKCSYGNVHDKWF